MFIILLFTVIGFLIGFAYVLKKKYRSLSKVFAAVILGLTSLAIWKIFENYQKKNRHRYH